MIFFEDVQTTATHVYAVTYRSSRDILFYRRRREDSARSESNVHELGRQSDQKVRVCTIVYVCESVVINEGSEEEFIYLLSGFFLIRWWRRRVFRRR